ncbi:MAG: hypothetical protein DRQ47_04380 [Gammaproteobacteria bacterium]|nr:MAG: hypothetical protein DRQ47_04380 [Gammaproteobacteria bacterium]
MMDSIIKSDLHYQEHTGVLTHVQTQPTEDIILERNSELRKNPGVLKDLSFGRSLANIPFNMYEKAIRDGFLLNSGDAECRSKELFRYLKSDEGKKCLVQG